MDYFEAREEDLVALEGGLRIVEHLNREKAGELGICLYGLTSDQWLLAEAKEAIIESAEEYWDENGDTTLADEDVTLSEIALSIPLSADDIYALLRTGFRVKDLDFAYNTGGGEGPRTGHFYESRWSQSKVTLKKLSRMALANSDLELRDFLIKSGNGQPMEIRKKTQRTEPAVETPNAAPAGTEVRASLSQVLEGFLG